MTHVKGQIIQSSVGFLIQLSFPIFPEFHMSYLISCCCTEMVPLQYPSNLDSLSPLLYSQ